MSFPQVELIGQGDRQSTCSRTCATCDRFLECAATCRQFVATGFDAVSINGNDSILPRPFLGSRALWSPGEWWANTPPFVMRQSDSDRQLRRRQTRQRRCQASLTRFGNFWQNFEYVAGILHGAAHREQLVWQTPKVAAGNGTPVIRLRQGSLLRQDRQRHRPARTQGDQSTGASSSTQTASQPPVVTSDMIPPNVTAVSWDGEDAGRQACCGREYRIDNDNGRGAATTGVAVSRQHRQRQRAEGQPKAQSKAANRRPHPPPSEDLDDRLTAPVEAPELTYSVIEAFDSASQVPT